MWQEPSALACFGIDDHQEMSLQFRFSNNASQPCAGSNALSIEDYRDATGIHELGAKGLQDSDHGTIRCLWHRKQDSETTTIARSCPHLRVAQLMSGTASADIELASQSCTSRCLHDFV